MSKKKMLPDFYAMKREGKKIAFLTSYDFPTAQFAEAAGLDMLLVGDSLGMCVYGYEGTVPVTMEQMIFHAQAVRRGAPDTFVIGDMPFMSYQSSTEKAVENAGRFLKEAQCDAIKLEGGKRVASTIRAIVDAGIVVMGHIGLTPQSSGQLGGVRPMCPTGRRRRSGRTGGRSPYAPAGGDSARGFIGHNVRFVHTRALHRRGTGLRRPALDRLGSDRAIPGFHA